MKALLGIAALAACLDGGPAAAQAPTFEQADFYFGIFQTIRNATGRSSPPQNAALLRSPDAVLWLEGSGKLTLLSLEGGKPPCGFDRVAPQVRSALSGALAPLNGLTSLNDAAAFPGGVIVSADLTDLLKSFTAHVPAGSCVIDIHVDPPGNALLGFMAPDQPLPVAEPGTLYRSGQALPVRRGLRTWLHEPAHRASLTAAIDALPVEEVLAFGETGLVTVAPDRSPSLTLWAGGRILPLLPWTEAQAIVNAEGKTLLRGNAMATMADEDTYFELLASIAGKSSGWRALARQAPHIIFRNWNAP